MGVKHGECFGMLGPNGAGKTTTINMLCGMFLPTSGKADLYQKDLVDDIKQIQKVMGVCPQHDLLWGSLTGIEHLLFYGRLRGLSGKELDHEVRKGLADVSLTFAAKKASKTYSGGMKRRLSVACCLIGKPKIVYLDEPSTGLDPASRRKLWDVIRRASKDCAMILTTHSMEEADALCDRITIMAAGKLRCLGSGALLKQEYGEGYKFSVSCPVDKAAIADEFVRNTVFSGAPDGTVTQLNSLGGTTNYTVSNTVVKDMGLSKVFRTMEETKSDEGSEVKIGDWGISEGTLEEVFSTITKKVVQSGQTKTEEELQAEKAEKEKEGVPAAAMVFAGAPGFASWWSAMPVHTYWLLRKNVLIYSRNANATGVLLGAGVIIMLFLRLMQELQGSGGGDQIYVGEDLTPEVRPIPNIPVCTTGDFDDCRSLVVYKPLCDATECQYKVGSAIDAKVDAVIERIIQNNGLPGIGEKKGVEVRTYNASDPDWKKDINSVLANKMNYTKLQIFIPTYFGYQIDCNASANGPLKCRTAIPAAFQQWGNSYSYDGSCQTNGEDFKCKMDYRFQVQTNNSHSCPQFGILGCDRPTEELTWPATVAGHNAIYQVMSGKTEAKWSPKWTTFPHGDLTWRFQQSIVNSFVPRFGMAAIVFMFVVQLGLLVREKELKLREALRMVGLKDAAYWLSWLIINCFMTFVGTLLMITSAFILDVKPIIVTDFAVSFSIFFSFALSMVAMTFIIAAILSNSKSATVLGFAFFIVRYLFSDVIGRIYDGTSDDLPTYQFILQFLSPVMFLRACASMSADTLVSGEGMRWACDGKFGCVDVTNDKVNYPVIMCINWIIYDTFIYIFVGWYLDKTLPSEYGSAEPLWFFLNPMWWLGKTSAEKEPAPYTLEEEKENMDGKVEEKDVEDNCKSTLMNDYNKDDTFVEIKRLKKTFGGNMTFGCYQPQAACCAAEDNAALLCCCCCHGCCGIPFPTTAPKFHAVKGVSYTIPDDELFCLLGPNGAGKTTTINMMTGLHPQTSGQIKVDGLSVKSDMQKVRKIMGCCPQHDILWSELTAAEHVALWARLKGVAVADIDEEVRSRLEAVDLAAVADRPAGAFSGGMLRRLSVTLSLTGEPKIAYMVSSRSFLGVAVSV
jgi:ABC-type multidrug transport system ATPase subunit